MRYVVTGAAGFIGSQLAEALVAQGHEVVGVDCFTDYYDVRIKEDNASGLEIDRLDLAEQNLDLAGVAGVFHLAGQPGVRSFGDVFDEYVHHNVLASRRVFEAAALAGVRVVFASSSSIYGNAESYPTVEETPPRPISPYGVTKLACEHLASAYAAAFGLDVVTLRYFTVYGPRQRPDMAFARLVEALATGAAFEVYGDGSQARAFTYVADVVDATVAAMERGASGGIYNIGGGSDVTLQQAIDVLERVAGRPLDIVRTPPAKGDVRRTAPDTTRAERELGWRPRTTLEDGLAAQWEWAVTRVAAR